MVITEWLRETNQDENFEEFSIEKLDQVLKDFYSEVLNTDGQLYAKSTFVGIRASISRHLRAPPFNKPFSLMADKEFHRSNQMFLGMIQKLKREGLDVTKHHSSISEGDLEKLRSSNVLTTENPKGLLRKVWFDIMLGFGRRGRENQRSFTDKTFAVKLDDRGFKYVEMVVSETTKNHRGGLTDDDFEKSPRIYATGQLSCPVNSFELYLAKRNPNSSHFFQLPRSKVKISDETWFTTRPYGEKMLNDMMKGISTDAGLSKTYTNHCVRATTITVLVDSGVFDREIMKITGHKCEASLSSYHSDSSDKQKRKYSAILQGADVANDTTVALVPPATTMQHGTTTNTLNTATPTTSVLSGFPCQMNNMNIMQQINNLPRHPVYNKQFEVHNSTVNVYNYQINQ